MATVNVKKRVLLIEPDVSTSRLEKSLDEEAGIELHSIEDMNALQSYFRQHGLPYAAIVDLGASGLRGGWIQYLKERWPMLPVVALGRNEDSDRVAAAMLRRADEYVRWPSVEGAEFAVRMDRVLKGVPSFAYVGLGDVLVDHGVIADIGRRKVWVHGEEVRLSATLARLLEEFLAARGQVIESSVLYERIWGTDKELSKKTLQVQISRLRALLWPSAKECDPLRITELCPKIITVPGLGYMLVDVTASSVDSQKQDKNVQAA